MNKHVERMTAIEKIDRSIIQSQNLEQLETTALFLNLYYQQYGFDTKYFRYEWNLDSKIKNRRIHLSLLEGMEEEDITITPEKASVKRLDAYVQTLSSSELNTIWPELRPQLDGVDLTLYPALRENVAIMRLNNQRRSQVREFPAILSRKRATMSAN